MALYTLSELAHWEEEVRKSRFLAYANHVDSPSEAMDFIEAYRIADATHNCWAYQIGDVYRFHDDGEPGGTAGRPIWQAIQGQECDYVVVLVIRWFGGIKLGTGGLMRAYGGCAAQCLRLAKKQVIVDEVYGQLHCAFADMSRLQARFDEFGVRIRHESFDADGVHWELALPSASKDALLEYFMNVTRGQGHWQGFQKNAGQHTPA